MSKTADARMRFRRLTELYVEGRAVPMRDGSFIWVQAMNPFERDEAIRDFQAARSRVMYGLRNKESESYKSAAAGFYAQDPAEVAREIVNAKLEGEYPRILQSIDQDPDWSERLQMLRRSQDVLDRPEEDEERVTVEAVAKEYMAEVEARMNNFESDEWERIQAKEDDALLDEYMELLIDRRGAELGIAEYRVTEFWYAVRACDAVLGEDGNLDHSACDHDIHLFKDRDEVRSLPTEMYKEITTALESIDITEYEAKN